MPLILTQPLERCPTFPELQALAGQHQVRIDGNELAGEFHHPDSEPPKITGHYVFGPDGDLHGDFSGDVMGKLGGSFSLTTGKAEIIITEKPFLLPKAVLTSMLSAALKDFCAGFADRK